MQIAELWPGLRGLLTGVGGNRKNLLMMLVLAVFVAGCAGRVGFEEDLADEAKNGVESAEAGTDDENPVTVEAGGDAPEGSSGTAIPGFNVIELPEAGAVDLDHELVYQIEADSIGGWAPATVLPTVSGHLILRSVYDLLVYPDATRAPQPMLLESFEPNEDSSVWTLTVRSGISFHDGTAFNAAAVVTNLERHRDGPISANFLRDVVSIEAVSDSVVEITLEGPRPQFPERLTTVVGYMASPTWLDAVDAGTASVEEPVGTGPFVFADYRPGRSFTATRNENYWQPDRPLLAGIKFQMTTNGRARYEAVTSAISPIAVVDNPEFIRRARDAIGQINLVESAANSETLYVMLNQADSESPLTDLQVRTALAKAVDREVWRVARGGSLFEAANGPFPPGSNGFLEDTGIPDFDVAGATELIAQYEAANGPVELGLLLEDTSGNLLSADLLTNAWAAVGVDVVPEFTSRQELMQRGLEGRFDMMLWQNHGSFDPGLQSIWWQSSGALPIGEPTANFSRINDEEIDAQLAIIESSGHPLIRQVAAENINRRFGEQSYNIWLSWPVWAVIHSLDVHLTGSTLPSGDPAMPMGGAVGGAHLIAHIWVEER